ncbi:hypothetical protein M422DRAFT_265169 [Sphaerobolus stellatus SS14]|uniref:Uncharacterized protein n=1 Tax=Sphaerobolus stellatus (strain SS14) TaxID=990650 RepID=A0A0C9V678_SPHS4|nr:hypothetical protein M422DRAFT_265169 [Sphaerobolus stellatus SS14]
MFFSVLNHVDTGKYTLTFMAQCFYARRIWFISGHKKFLSGSMIFLSFCQLGTGYVNLVHLQGYFKFTQHLLDTIRICKKRKE